MKFVHTGDIHWGMLPDSDKPWGKERASDIHDTFAKIIDKVKEEKAELLLISGDLFHRQPLRKDLMDVDYYFSTIPDVRVVIIAGNHDRVRKNSAVLSFTWSPNVFFLSEEVVQSIYFEDINTEVTGFSYHTPEIEANRLDDLSAPSDGRIHILIGHGGDKLHVPFDKSALSSSGFNYIALGHIHKPDIIIPGQAAYCGSPEPLDKTETGAHGIIVGEIRSASAGAAEFQFVPLAKIRYIPLIVNVTPSTSSTELYSKLAHEMDNRGVDNIYRLKIKGKRNPEVTYDLEGLTLRYRIADIYDESEPEYDFSDLFAMHPDDMIGFYIRALEKPDMSLIEKKALYYGIDALLKTQDERS